VSFADTLGRLINNQPAGLKQFQDFFGSIFAVKKELVFGSLPKERTEILINKYFIF